MKRTRNVFVLAVVAALLALATACAPSEGPSVIGLGRHFGLTAVLPILYDYDGTAGERLNVGVVNQRTSFLVPDPSVTVVGPNGATPPHVGSGCQYASCKTLQLPTRGRYQIYVTQQAAEQTHYELDLSHDADAGALPLGVTLATPLIGQTLRYTYDGTAGEGLNAAVSRLVDPNGTPVPIGPFDPHVVLGVTGTYSLFVCCAGGIVSHDIDGGTIGLGNTVGPQTVNFQRVLYSYDGVAGEAIGIGVVNNIARWEVLDPLGNVILQPDRVVLPVTGTYTFVFISDFVFNPAMAPVSIWLSHDLDGGTIAPGTTVAPTGDLGQWLGYEYEGTAGQTIHIETHPDLPGPFHQVTLTAPDGSRVPSTDAGSGENFALPTSGTYHLLIGAHEGGGLTVTLAIV